MARTTRRLRKGYAHTKKNRTRKSAARRRTLLRRSRLESLESRQVLSAVPLTAAELTDHVVYAAPEAIELSEEGQSHAEIDHGALLALDEGSIALSFTAESIEGRTTLFSKDHTGRQDGGHLTVWLVDGQIEVRLQSEVGEERLRSAVGAIEAGEEHHVAVSFGEYGARLYVDGLIADAEVDFDQSLGENTNSLVIGASTTRRDGDRLNLREHFEGTIESFTVYDAELGLQAAAELVGVEYVAFVEPTELDGTLHGTDGVDTLWWGMDGFLRDLNGGYGNDWVFGSADADTLDGGHGEDIVVAGAGDDLIISRSDGREPIIAQDYSGEDPRGEVNDPTRTLYADQPIASDDFLVGGEGADTFRFEILLNAKERILFKHVEDDGSIDWAGVTGENRDVHDHWVDRFGNDVILDFSREEGDFIEFVGHTVDVYKVEHVDSDGDGVLDASKIYVQSNQGNAGAHNKDQLGTVTVYGDLVLPGDYHVHAHANLGIVETIGELGEALAPRYGTPQTPVEDSRWHRRVVSEAPLPEDAVFAVGQELSLDGEQEEYVNVDHTDRLALEAGTIALSFTADSLEGRQTLFSKDHTGRQDGGHLTVWLVEGQVEVRLQSIEGEKRLRSAEGAIEAGQEHHVAVSFGEEGARLYIDGLIADAEIDFTQSIAANDNSLVIGASATRRNGDRLNLKEFFSGTINDFVVYDEQLSLTAVAEIAGLDLTPLAAPLEIDGVLTGTDGGEQLVGQFVNAEYGDDIVTGTDSDDILDGGHGEDQVSAGAGDDLIISRSDGREPIIAQDYSGEDPRGEVNEATGTIYADQPIASDDVLTGGEGADTFRFEILVNAKERILFKHVEDDGTIDWAGVTGENRDVHDHWVDRFGDEVITDFNREEGDFIEFVGHTVDVYKVEHIDSDGDGVLDETKMYVQSNQGNAGAHNKDQLGTVTVYGDLVLPGDYHVHAHANLGIVETIGELGEALAPRDGSPVVTDGTSRWLQSEVIEAPLPEGAVFAVGQGLFFTGEEDYVNVAHSVALELDEGTFAVAFEVNDTTGKQTLFSKDHSGFQNGGHITAWVVDGRVEVRLQSDTQSMHLVSAEGAISNETVHHVAVSFGEEGARLFVDGLIADAKIDFTQGISTNSNSLVIGASTVSRKNDDLNTQDYLQGVVHDLVVYDEQLSLTEVAEVAGLDLTPLAAPEVIDGVLMGTDNGEELVGQFVNAEYGDDIVTGTDENDILDGGHGEDQVFAGAGDDLIISRSDGREPIIAQDYSGEDPRGEVNDPTRTLYADQPIASDDFLVGGEGADTFRFEILLNAKERILFKHVEDDGSIDWAGVTGENRDVHDHWVDRFGNDVILDFSREEGDFIEFVGHTVDVYKVEHVDSDGDGVLDASKIYVQSNQGNAGAHNKDQLGTVTVYGDLVLPGDYHVHAHANLGIVETIGELGEALAPRYGTPQTPVEDSRWHRRVVSEAPLPEDAVFAVGQELRFFGEDENYVNVAHNESFELDEGTIAVSFSVDDTVGKQTLFSKDHSGFENGGHITAWVIDDRIEVRLQSDSFGRHLSSEPGVISKETTHEVLVSFGGDGFQLYVDGELIASRADFTQGIAANDNSLVIGASSVSRKDDDLNEKDFFSGVIHELAVYDMQADELLLATSSGEGVLDEAFALID